MQTTVRIERYADQGRCVGHVDGRVVFVRFALPGELVNVALDEPHERKDRFWTGEIVEVLEASDRRVAPVWPLAGPLADGGGVGGADLIHVSLPGQLDWKSTVITEQMHRLGHVDLPKVGVESMAGDEALSGLHWRTRIEMIADDEGRPSMRRRESHQRVPIDTMPLASQALLEVADHCGVWRGGFDPGASIRLAVPEPRDQGDGDLLTDIGENYALMVGDEVKAGSAKLHESADIDGTRFAYDVHADGFWQVHRRAPMVLPDHVLRCVRALLDGRPHATVWDLYSGAGLFTLPLAKKAADTVHMLSVEGSKPAVRQARENLTRAGIDTVEAHSGDVARALRFVPRHLAHPDVVVLDPPRAGARAAVCRRIAESGAHGVVYVACDPTSLARDTATFADEGYRLTDIHAFDIYPMTHHVETVAVFERAQHR